MYRKEVHIMPQIRPITDLRNTTEISNLCHAKKEPIFITKNGYGDMVVMSMDTYDELLELAMSNAAIAEAEEELARGGVTYDAREQLAALRRKHFG
jgi:PHD/YefM family antitoxin component YafN of YafNO toxin-antitoxin module